ncbi:hypothetical protein [Mucilaginibacter sp. OK098]|uniref:hypothetical protein n=1 Tax=Mucilaginibacter sp. OK098 TaxID=1855297 RepID=UPI0009213218|nr:hypothetical protein [Mucilaginibacter sp. OK098]SHN26223.1 hypothetical protein SAMN05216524_107393 [Mucilaginibacter sp. OK098]
MNNTIIGTLLVCFLASLVLFAIGAYIIRAVLNIPGIMRLQKAQVRLLQEMAKSQGVDNKTVQTIISETQWETLN